MMFTAAPTMRLEGKGFSASPASTRAGSSSPPVPTVPAAFFAPYQPPASGTCRGYDESSPGSQECLVSVAGDDMLATRPLKPTGISPPPGLEHLGSPVRSPALSEAEARPNLEPLLPFPTPPAYRPQVADRPMIPPPPSTQPRLRTVPPPPSAPAPEIMSQEAFRTPPPAPREEPCLRLALSTYLLRESEAAAGQHDDCKPCAFFHTKGCPWDAGSKLVPSTCL
ncbi:unnamed protein product [Symbiodinium natans]|uniref:Uncharacterized protein n=1 Tax=Symbiodinium natans TaxID=878477 RepID=A0A812LH19_9DINO|nr:unnamed protein product [Symbiodinium natans]